MSCRFRQSGWSRLLVLAWVLAGAGSSRGQSMEPGARAGASLWDGPSAPPAPAASSHADFEGRVTALEKSIGDLEKAVGSPRSLRVRQPIERRLEDLEARLDKMEKRLNDLENRVKRAEQRK